MTVTDISLRQLDRLAQDVELAIVEDMSLNGAASVAVPPIGAITGACENVYMSFAVAPNRYLVQTGQLFLEAAIVDHPAVGCSIWSCRNEVPDARHLQQFRLLEEEFRWSAVSDACDADQALQHLVFRAQSVLRAGIRGALENSSEELMTTLGRTTELETVVAREWPVVRHEEAAEFLVSVGRPNATGDFGEADESMLVDHFGGGMLPILVTRYPEEIKFFNMRVDRSDPSRVLSLDVLLPISGEVIGGAVREDDHAMLAARLERSSMLRQHLENGGRHTDFAAYLALVEQGLPPHAGYGLGLERLLQFIVAERDIRLASTTYRRSASLGW